MDQATLQTVANFIGWIIGATILSIAIGWSAHRNRLTARVNQQANTVSNEKLKNDVVSEVTTQTQSLADKLDHVNAQLISTLTGRVDEQVKRLDEFSIRTTTLETDNRTLTKTVSHYKELSDAQASKLDQSNKYIAALEKTIAEYKVRMDSLSERYELQIAEQGKRINDKDAQLTDKEARIEELTAQVSDLIAKLETESKIVATLTQRVTALESAVTALEAKLQTKDIELQATLLNKAELESKLALVTAERDAAYKERDEQVSRMQIEIDTLRTALDDLSAKFSALSPVTESQ